jgi:hypothetical protein
MNAIHTPRLVGASRLLFFDASRSSRPLSALGLAQDAALAIERMERELGVLVHDSGFQNNLTVTNGKNKILDRLFGLSAATAITSVGIGTDSTATAAAQAQLNPSVAGSVYLQAADAGASRAGQVVSIQATIATGNGNFAIAEGALFDGTTNGTSAMLCRLVYASPFTKSSSVSLVAQWSYQQN